MSPNTPPTSQKIQIQSSFIQEPGSHYHSKVISHNTGKTREADSTATEDDAVTKTNSVTISKNPNTVTTNGKTESWDDWVARKSGTAVISSPPTGKHRERAQRKESTAAAAAAAAGTFDPQRDPATVGFDASQL
ncbi:hypothetical protein AAFC00_002013 [Neodothiora populina]|uniref:Uncharacterized protein n=1 Tax=Neodothiora populina TaxID=2781224 RepID=A0ABR3PG28_9PEZI